MIQCKYVLCNSLVCWLLLIMVKRLAASGTLALASHNHPSTSTDKELLLIYLIHLLRTLRDLLVYVISIIAEVINY